MKTTNSSNMNVPMLPNLRFSTSILFSFLALVGMTQTYEVGPNADNMIISVTGSHSNVLMDAGFALTTGASNTIIGSSAGQHSDGSYEFQNVCNQAFLSRSQLYRRIKRISGLSTTLFIRKIRLQKAKAILNSDTNIKMNQLAV